MGVKRGAINLNIKNKIVTRILKEPQTLTDSLEKRAKRRTMDMRFGAGNVRSLYSTGSLVTVSKGIRNCTFDLAEVQEIRWEGRGTEYTFFHEKGNENCSVSSIIS